MEHRDILYLMAEVNEELSSTINDYKGAVTARSVCEYIKESLSVCFEQTHPKSNCEISAAYTSKGDIEIWVNDVRFLYLDEHKKIIVDPEHMNKFVGFKEVKRVPKFRKRNIVI